MASVAVDHSQTASDSIRAEAAAGSFRAIALWLNEYLVPQQIFAQVQAAQPGCLKITLEFQNIPHRDRLVRFVCHRIWHLNSDIIEGVHLVARQAQQSRILWQERVRISTPANRHQAKRPAPTAELPPQLKRSAKAANGQPPRSPQQQFKLIRAFLLSGSAAAAFILGCLLEVLLSGSGPSLPIFSQNQSRSALVQSPAVSEQAIPITFNQTKIDRPSIVEAALEPVAVIHHNRIANQSDPTVTLVFGGEVDLDSLPYGSVTDDAAILGSLADYQTADVAMVSLGDPLATSATTATEKFFDRTRPDAAAVLKSGGIDLVTLSSDRTMEFGEQGLVETLETLDREGIYRVGAGRDNREARRPEILDVKSQRIAYLSYTQDDLFAAYGQVAGVNAQGKQQVVEDIRSLRDKVDWIVVNYRWSEELPNSPADWQTNLARLAIDQGADLVVGHHPQQIQGAEIYKGRPIAYSLGDFVFGDYPYEDHDTAMLKVAIRANEMKVELLPVVIKDAQPQIAQGSKAESILQQIEQASANFEQPMQPSVTLAIQPKPRLAPPSPSPVVPRNVTPPEQLQQRDAAEPFVAPLETPETQPEAPFVNPEAETGTTEAPLLELTPSDLDHWGPKQTPQPVFPAEPERQPNLLPLETPAPELTTEPALERPIELDAYHAPQPNIYSPHPPALETNSPGAIQPYSEPLVGPLSAVPSLPAVEPSPVTPVATNLDQGVPEPIAIQKPDSSKFAQPQRSADTQVTQVTLLPEPTDLGVPNPNTEIDSQP
ncbi:CapA family protein [Almyronema epifaneia]|uniref:CapA family protein n=1 Tax=Almyronema epifaneia S1 TaxID=2991925 RepID=A0ABW6IIX0_9CYAN